MDERHHSADRPGEKPTAVGAFTRLADSAAELLDQRATRTRDAAMPSIGLALRGGILLAGAGLAAVLGLQALITVAIAALGVVLPVWGAALIAGGVLLAGAGLAGMIGTHKLIRALADLRSHEAQSSHHAGSASRPRA